MLATRFIGRTRELLRVRELFERGHPLVTIWGTGGAGKTRLALCYAGQQDRPSTFCDLSHAATLDSMLTQVASALELETRATSEENVRELGKKIRARGAELFIFDNFEQLTEVGATVIADWLRLAPQARFLVTSREKLSLSSEAGMELSPMPVPKASESTEAIARAESVELFIDRVQLYRPELTINDDNAGKIRDLIERVEGLPLAIELAAARYDALGIDGVMRRISEPMTFLVRAPRDAPARHATLRNAIAWSWDLLDAHEQRALAECAVFCGGFFTEAAEAILTAPPNRSVLEVLEALRSKSLLRAETPNEAKHEMRFSMLASIRDFALEQLQHDEHDIRARHADYYTQLGESFGLGINGPDAARMMSSLSIERENLLAAIENATEPELAFRALLALEPLYSSQGPNGSYLRLLDAQLAKITIEDAGVLLYLQILRSRGRTHHVLGQVELARRDLLRALELAEQLGSSLAKGQLLTDLGALHHRARELPEALAHYQRALEIHRTGHDRLSTDAEEGRVLGVIGAVHHDAKRFEEARPYYRSALELFQRVQHRRLEGRFLANLGVLEQELGALEDARASYDRALLALREVGDRRLEAITLGNLGVLEHRAGAHETARAHHRRAIAMLRKVGDPRSEALALARLGGVEATLNELAGARERLAEAEQLSTQIGDPITEEIVRLHRGFLEIALSLDAWIRGQAAEAIEHAENTRGKIDRARAPGKSRASLSETSDDARSTIAILERLLEGLEVWSDGDGPLPADALILGPGARSFRAPLGEWVDFRRRQPLRKILLCLVEQLRAKPGAGTALDPLIERAWPGEKIQSEAAANRLYVALASLRKLGLKECLLSRDDGYLLDPATRVIWTHGRTETHD
jgi:predicted ATPase/Tfp pilus assembly protein PilF